MSGSVDVLAYLGLGSNLGDRRRNIVQALTFLDKSPDVAVMSVSALYETTPVGGPDQPDYLNAATVVKTSLDSEELLEICLGIEYAMGRKRTVKNAARVIDIDIELFGDSIINTANLVIPHPRMHERYFVMKPLADIAPDACHPVLGRTVSELLADLSSEGASLYSDMGNWRTEPE